MARPRGIYHRYRQAKFGEPGYWDSVFCTGDGYVKLFGTEKVYDEDELLGADEYQLIGPLSVPKVPLKLHGKG